MQGIVDTPELASFTVDSGESTETIWLRYGTVVTITGGEGRNFRAVLDGQTGWIPANCLHLAGAPGGEAEESLSGTFAPDLLLPLPKDLPFSPDTVVTWVTMPENRRRDRMIDHGRLLAEAAAKRLGLSCRRLLNRRETRQKNQASLGSAARRENLKNAFEPCERIDFPVLLVDDVLTTGTTARRCAEALRKGGAEKVSVLTFTRATRMKDGI